MKTDQSVNKLQAKPVRAAAAAAARATPTALRQRITLMTFIALWRCSSSKTKSSNNSKAAVQPKIERQPKQANKQTERTCEQRQSNERALNARSLALSLSRYLPTIPTYRPRYAPTLTEFEPASADVLRLRPRLSSRQRSRASAAEKNSRGWWQT